jgi:hypothetical protein
MDLRKLLLSTLVTGVMTTSFAQTVVLPYVPGTTTEGVTYYLPKTAFNVTVTATCTTLYPGELNAYAGRYLKLNNVTKEVTHTWTIKDISITPYGIADTSKVYSIPLKKATIAPLVSLTKQGTILSINATAEEESIVLDPKIHKVENNKLNSKDYMSQEILYAGSISKMAELTANEIYDIRESRSDLTKGEADNMPKDGEQLKLMIQQLNLQEEALLQLFKGSEEIETRSFTFSFCPEKNLKKEILFRFSTEKGVVEKDDLAGEPIYIDLTDLKTIPAEKIDPKKKKTDEQAVRYNVASDTNIKIYSRTNKYLDFNAPVAQFGRVEVLSNELFNKRTSTQVFFNQTTGTLSRVVEDNTNK